MSGCVVFRLPSPEGRGRKTLLVNFFSEAQSSQGLINVNLLYQRHLFCRYRNVLTAGSISGNISQCLYTTASARSASRRWKINLHQTSSSTQLMLDKLKAVFHMMGMTTRLWRIQEQSVFMVMSDFHSQYRNVSLIWCGTQTLQSSLFHSLHIKQCLFHVNYSNNKIHLLMFVTVLIAHVHCQKVVVFLGI